jgi:hypothetical protein
VALPVEGVAVAVGVPVAARVAVAVEAPEAVRVVVAVEAPVAVRVVVAIGLLLVGDAVGALAPRGGVGMPWALAAASGPASAFALRTIAMTMAAPQMRSRTLFAR